MRRAGLVFLYDCLDSWNAIGGSVIHGLRRRFSQTTKLLDEVRNQFSLAETGISKKISDRRLVMLAALRVSLL